MATTLFVGLVGSVVGGLIANLMGTGDIFELNVIGFIAAVIASVVLIGILRHGRGPNNALESPLALAETA